MAWVYASISWLLWLAALFLLYRDALRRIDHGPLEGWSPGCWSGLGCLGLPGWVVYLWMNGTSPSVVWGIVLLFLAGLIQLIPILTRPVPGVFN